MTISLTKQELYGCYMLIKKYNNFYIGELVYDSLGKTVLKKVVHKKLFEVQHQLKIKLIKYKLKSQ